MPTCFKRWYGYTVSRKQFPDPEAEYKKKLAEAQNTRKNETMNKTTKFYGANDATVCITPYNMNVLVWSLHHMQNSS